LKLTVQENNQLIEWTRRHKTSQALALRAHIILACAQGKSNSEVAKRCRVIRQTVGKWRNRFLERGLDGLFDEPRPGAPRMHDDAKIEQLIATTLNERPAEATHWSTRLLARKLNMSQSTVSRAWRAFGLQPHRSETFKLSTDPLFIDKVRDIVGLYLNPPTKAMVLCVDEKSQIQALDRTQPVLPLAPGLIIERRALPGLAALRGRWAVQYADRGLLVVTGRRDELFQDPAFVFGRRGHIPVSDSIGELRARGVCHLLHDASLDVRASSLQTPSPVTSQVRQRTRSVTFSLRQCACGTVENCYPSASGGIGAS
jgi:transposase